MLRPHHRRRARYTALVTKEVGAFLTDTLAVEKQAEFDLREVEMSARDAEGLGFGIRGQVQAHHDSLTDEEIWTVLPYIKGNWPPNILAEQQRRSEAARK